VGLGEYLYGTGRNDAALAAFERAVTLVPPEPASPERAYALGSLAGGLMVAWRHAESMPIAEQALELARELGAGEAQVRALTVVGMDRAYMGRAEDGLEDLRQAVRLAEQIGDHLGLERAYINLTDALTMLGKPGESARVAETALHVFRRYSLDETVLAANYIEALLVTGDWDRADELSAAAIRRFTASFPYIHLIFRADLEIGRGAFDDARAHLDAAAITLREDRWLGIYDAYLAELALWERRWADADRAVRDGLARASVRSAAQIRVRLCALGLRVQAERAALSRAHRDDDAVRERFDEAAELLATARRAAAEAAAITPNTAAWRALAEAEFERAGGRARPEVWAEAAGLWDELERPPLAAYCRWRQAEALVAAGAPRAEATVPLRQAHVVAAPIGARPLLRELELLAERARLELVPPEERPGERHAIEEQLGLTPREAEVLALVARGLTNREIADELVISVKTAGVHVSHILRKLDAPNRLEAAAIAHRIADPGDYR
jgi:DNA-binding CsgD family transcriptional regulator